MGGMSESHCEDHVGWQILFLWTVQSAIRTLDYFHFTLDIKYVFSFFYIKDTKLGEVWHAKQHKTPSHSNSQ